MTDQPTPAQVLAVPCPVPTCAAPVGERCRERYGQRRSGPHRGRVKAARAEEADR